MTAYAQDAGRIDTFRLKYSFKRYERTTSVNYCVYVGMLNQPRLIGNNSYKKLVFGDSLNSVIALVRQTDKGLYFIPDPAVNAKKERPLLFFNKKVNKKWKVHIDNSLFWRKEITFTGIQHTEDDDLYVYSLKTIEGYWGGGNGIAKIYYSRKNGFVKLGLKTHWITSDVDKSE